MSIVNNKVTAFMLLHKCITDGTEKIFEDAVLKHKIDESNSLDLLPYGIFVEMVYSISIRRFIDFYKDHCNNPKCVDFIEIFSNEIKSIDKINCECMIKIADMKDPSCENIDDCIVNMLDDLHILIEIEDDIKKMIEYFHIHPECNTEYFNDCIKMYDEYNQIVDKLIEVTFN